MPPMPPPLSGRRSAGQRRCQASLGASAELITLACTRLNVAERSLSSMSLSGLAEQLERLTERFAGPSAEAASLQGVQEGATAFHRAALAAFAAEHAGSSAERAALLR